MRKWLHSPALLLHLTAPSLPCRVVPWGVRAPPSPTTTLTVTPALHIVAPAPVAWLLPRAQTTTPAAPVSPAPSPPHRAPPSLCRWQTRRTTAATSPLPVMWEVTVPLCQGTGLGSLHRTPLRCRHNSLLMWFLQPLQMSYRFRDTPLSAPKESLQLHHFLFHYSLIVCSSPV